MSLHRPTALALAAGMLAASIGQASAACTIDGQGSFAGEGVRLARPQSLGATANFAVYRAPLAVNTDGAPTSYHPEDFLGETRAINRIDNGIAIRRADGSRLSVAEKRRVFDLWRSTPDWTVPQGFRITWQNVIAATPQGKPCVFGAAAGEHAGYFGSLTALQNGLSGPAAGECGAANQLDQRFIPAIVLRGDASSPLRRFGARTGDLVLAVNPATAVVVPAVIGDTGDGNRIGEGSVALNMALLGRTEQPRTFRDALGLDTGTREMVVAVLPGTIAFRRERPYSAANLRSRVEAWAQERGYGGLQGLADAALDCASGL